MGLRAILGLCEHKCKPTGHVIETSVRPVVTPSQKHVTGYIDVRECEKCGQTKGFRL
jgi:hypothetical protein